MPTFHVVHVHQTVDTGPETLASGYAVFRSEGGREGAFVSRLYRTEAEATTEAQKLHKETTGANDNA